LDVRYFAALFFAKLKLEVLPSLLMHCFEEW